MLKLVVLIIPLGILTIVFAYAYSQMYRFFMEYDKKLNIWKNIEAHVGRAMEWDKRKIEILLLFSFYAIWYYPVTKKGGRLRKNKWNSTSFQLLFLTEFTQDVLVKQKLLKHWKRSFATYTITSKTISFVTKKVKRKKALTLLCLLWFVWTRTI